MQYHCKGTYGVLDVCPDVRLMVLLPNHHVNKGKLRWSLMMAVMDVDLLLGIEQALMLHSISINDIVLCIFDVALAISNCLWEGMGPSLPLPFSRSESSMTVIIKLANS